MQVLCRIAAGMILLAPAALFAQQDLATHFLQGTWQANRTNPAMIPDGKVIIALPGMYNSLYANGITYNTLITETDGGETILDVDAWIAGLESRNFIKEYLHVETLTLGLSFGGLHLNAGHSTRFTAFSKYPKELLQVAWQGNAQFIGQEVEIGLNSQVMGQHEFGLGAAYRFSNGLSIGGKDKLLNGFGDTTTGEGQEQVCHYTREDT